MKKLIIESTANSPKVHFDPDNNIFEISGESRPPNVPVFYDQVISWIKEFSNYRSQSPQKRGTVEFNLDLNYFNSSSAKYLLDFFCGFVRVAKLGITKQGTYGAFGFAFEVLLDQDLPAPSVFLLE